MPGVSADKIIVPGLEERALKRIETEYCAADRDAVRDLLGGYAGPERERVIWDLLVLSRGNSEKLLSFLHSAQRDYRDILYWAEYYDHDPMLKGRDPKELVKQLLAKLG